MMPKFCAFSRGPVEQGPKTGSYSSFHTLIMVVLVSVGVHSGELENGCDWHWAD